MVRLRGWASTAADVATLAAIGVGLVLGAVGGAWAQLQKVGVGWSIVAAVGLFLVAAAGTRGLIRWWRNHTDPVGEEYYLREKRIRLTDLVIPGDAIVSGRTFDHCRLIGPAVLFIDGVGALDRCQWKAPSLDALFIEITQPFIYGPIVFRDCTFRECRFEGVGLIGNHDQIEKYRTGFVGA
jgi:hypothetical protein